MRLIIFIFLMIFPIKSATLGNKCIAGIYLQNLMYTSERVWKIRINERTFVHSTKMKMPMKIRRWKAMIADVLVTRVSKEGVHFVTNGHAFFLRPGQSFDVLRKKNIWGRCMYPDKNIN